MCAPPRSFRYRARACVAKRKQTIQDCLSAAEPRQPPESLGRVSKLQCPSRKRRPPYKAFSRGGRTNYRSRARELRRFCGKIQGSGDNFHFATPQDEHTAPMNRPMGSLSPDERTRLPNVCDFEATPGEDPRTDPPTTAPLSFRSAPRRSSATQKEIRPAAPRRSAPTHTHTRTRMPAPHPYARPRHARRQRASHPRTPPHEPPPQF